MGSDAADPIVTGSKEEVAVWEMMLRNGYSVPDAVRKDPRYIAWSKTTSKQKEQASFSRHAKKLQAEIAAKRSRS